MSKKQSFKISMAAARVNANLTQKQTAELMGVHHSTIVSWEAGKTFPTVAQMEHLCRIYKIPIDYIFLSQNPQKVDTQAS